MTVLDERVNEILTIYEDLRDRYKMEIEHSPSGSLIHQMKGNQTQFIHSFYDNGKRISKGINKKTDMIRALARKEFSIKAYKILSNNIDAFKEAITKQIPFDPERILHSMTKAYSFLPEEFFFDRNPIFVSAELDKEILAKVKRHEEWWKKPYKEYWGYPENKTRITSRGQKVRSISELLIAEALYKYSIPFHYEEELEADGKIFAPDFTFEGMNQNMFYLDFQLF